MDLISLQLFQCFNEMFEVNSINIIFAGKKCHLIHYCNYSGDKLIIYQNTVNINVIRGPGQGHQ